MATVQFIITASVPYGRHVEKIEYPNHAAKCYHLRFANIVKDNPSVGGSGKLTNHIITKSFLGSFLLGLFHAIQGAGNRIVTKASKVVG